MKKFVTSLIILLLATVQLAAQKKEVKNDKELKEEIQKEIQAKKTLIELEKTLVELESLYQKDQEDAREEMEELYVLLLEKQVEAELKLANKNNEKNLKKTKYNVARNIEFDKNSSDDEIVILIDENTQSFGYMIETRLYKGELTIELYDPNNVKRDSFKIRTQLKSAKSEIVSGTIKDILYKPEKGEWKIKIITNSASGSVNINQNTILIK